MTDVARPEVPPEAPPEAAFYSGKKVLVTGHTGFKGAWLALWLEQLGAKVAGLSLAPDTDPSLFTLAKLDSRVESAFGDVRDLETVSRVIREHQPEVVFHLAAQALVRRSYRAPLDTLATNVMGTANLLEAIRHGDSVRAVVVVTSDKCYENREQLWAYRESDRVGGHDPYSASKGCAELVTAAFRSSYLAERGVGVASARAGNVIGGGDWAEDRLVPDLARGAFASRSVAIRNPSSTRPWQHVLEPLSGYLSLARHLVRDPAGFAEGWNFGPADADDGVEVGVVAERFVRALGRGSLELPPPDAGAPHEAHLLRVDSAKARSRLGWRPRLSLEQAVDWTARWYREAWLEGSRDAADLVFEQTSAYEALARR